MTRQPFKRRKSGYDTATRHYWKYRSKLKWVYLPTYRKPVYIEKITPTITKRKIVKGRGKVVSPVIRYSGVQVFRARTKMRFYFPVIEIRAHVHAGNVGRAVAIKIDRIIRDMAFEHRNLIRQYASSIKPIMIGKETVQVSVHERKHDIGALLMYDRHGDITKSYKKRF